MTTRTYQFFSCVLGHTGRETTAENDQPYSKMWESVTFSKTMMQSGKDAQGDPTYVCAECKTPMFPVAQPTPEESKVPA